MLGHVINPSTPVCFWISCFGSLYGKINHEQVSKVICVCFLCVRQLEICCLHGCKRISPSTETAQSMSLFFFWSCEHLLCYVVLTVTFDLTTNTVLIQILHFI